MKLNEKKIFWLQQLGGNYEKRTGIESDTAGKV